jgi:hypothetical protein
VLLILGLLPATARPLSFNKRIPETDWFFAEHVENVEFPLPLEPAILALTAAKAVPSWLPTVTGLKANTVYLVREHP